MNYGLTSIIGGGLLIVTAWFFPERGVPPGPGVLWEDPPRPLRAVLRRGSGGINLILAVVQLWGWLLVLAGLLILVGVIPDGRPALTSVLAAGLVGAGAVVLALLAAASRFGR